MEDNDGENPGDVGGGSRGIHRSDGGSGTPDRDAAGAAVESAAAHSGVGEREDDGEHDGESSFSRVVEIAQSFTGPLPPAQMLSQYDTVVPGSAKQIVEAHLRREQVGADALERLTRAEALGVTFGAVGAQVLTLGSLIFAGWLILQGYTLPAVGAFIPAFLGGAALVVSAWRKNSG